MYIAHIASKSILFKYNKILTNCHLKITQPGHLQEALMVAGIQVLPGQHWTLPLQGNLKDVSLAMPG